MSLAARLLATRFTALQWAILVSGIIHALLLWQLWQFRFTVIFPQSLTQFVVKLVDVLSSERGISSVIDRPPQQQQAASFAGRKTAVLSRDNTTKMPSGTVYPQEQSGGVTDSTGMEGVVTDPGGIAVGGPSQGSVGSVPGGQALGSATRPGVASGKGSGNVGKGSPSIAEQRAIVVPPSIQRTTTQYESEVYAVVSFYTLFTPDLRVSQNVPANQVCLDGDIIRTFEREVISHRETDISKCRYVDMGGDQERMRCPPEAHTTVISYNNYFFSPVNYSVNVCLEYDKSNCYWTNPDGPEREVCRDSGKYEGIWAQGTMFQYRCTKSVSQTFTHPLEYEVRFMQDVEFPDMGIHRRLVDIEKRPIARCE